MKLQLFNVPKLALQRRGSAILGMLIIMLLWAGVFFTFRANVQQNYANMEQRNQNYALLFEENILRSIGEIDKALLYLRRSVEAFKDNTDYQTIVSTTDVLSEIIIQAAIIDAEGISRGSNAKPAPTKLIDVSDREHFKVHVNSNDDKLFISKPLIGRASNKWSVQFTRRFSNQDGTFAGVVVASMDPAHFTSLYNRLELGATTSVTMIGSDGFVRSRGGGEVVQFALGDDLSGTDLFAKTGRGLNGTFMEPGPTADADILVTLRPVRGHPLWVMVSTKEQDIYASAWANLRQNTLIVAVLTLLVLIGLEKILRSEAKAGQKAQQLQLTLEHMGQGIMLVTKDREIPIINRRCAELLLLPQETIETPPGLDELLGNRVNKQLIGFLDKTATNTADGDDSSPDAPPLSIADFKRDDGAYIEVRKTQLPDGGFVQTFTDITTRREAETYIAKLASEDPLTALHNRRAFRTKLQELSDATPPQRFAVLFMDIDRFKVVNDTIGHRAGDQLLVQIAERLQCVLQESTTLARLGGDEFAILVPAIESRAEIEKIAQRIIDALAYPFVVEQHAITTGLSIGVAIAPDDGNTVDELLVAADLALYAVKVGGRGAYRFYEKSMNDDVNSRREIELDLREALNKGTLDVYYQPIADVQNNSITGFEALARWPHPTKGMISPAKFIPVAEDCGLIAALGSWVLMEACRTAMEWPDELKVSVNVSPIQLASSDLIGTIESVLTATGLDPQRLALEFTETIFIEDGEKTVSTLHKLKQIGVQVALDDFGTGYSSLSYLRSFPFDTVKIDRSFISGLGADTNSNVIVQGVIMIAGGLGIRTVAEGVETDDQLRLLKLLGCREVQGYLLSPPKPSADARSLIERWPSGHAAAA